MSNRRKRKKRKSKLLPFLKGNDAYSYSSKEMNQIMEYQDGYGKPILIDFSDRGDAHSQLAIKDSLMLLPKSLVNKILNQVVFITLGTQGLVGTYVPKDRIAGRHAIIITERALYEQTIDAVRFFILHELGHWFYKHNIHKTDRQEEKQESEANWFAVEHLEEASKLLPDDYFPAAYKEITFVDLDKALVGE